MKLSDRYSCQPIECIHNTQFGLRIESHNTDIITLLNKQIKVTLSTNAYHKLYHILKLSRVEIDITAINPKEKYKLLVINSVFFDRIKKYTNNQDHNYYVEKLHYDSNTKYLEKNFYDERMIAFQTIKVDDLRAVETFKAELIIYHSSMQERIEFQEGDNTLNADIELFMDVNSLGKWILIINKKKELNENLSLPLVTTRIKKSLFEFSKEYPHFFCPITYEIMQEPYKDLDGQNYDKEAIYGWLKTHYTNPITKEPLFISDLEPNLKLKNEITKVLANYQVIDD